MNYQYAYDKMDNITAKQTEHGDYDYGYDDLYRLTNAESPKLNAESFSYDSVGNRLTAADTTGDWTYNFNNELEGYDDVSYVYDDNGNMIQKTVDGVVTSYVYNVEDRLAEVWDGEVGTGSLIAEYYYDPFGRRLWKDVGGQKTYYHYADEGLVGEYDGTGAEIKTYGYKPGSTWTTDPLFIKQNNQYYFYHNDHLGTPQKITAMNGAVVWSAKYESFGKANVEVETITNNLRFPGQYYDQETGLHYNYFRYYDSVAGRYLSVDSVGLNGGNRNLYTYANLNPHTYIDGLGLRGRLPSGDVKRRTTLKTYAMTQVGQGNDCISMVNIINKAAELNDNSIDFINDLQAVLVGYGLDSNEGRGRGKYLVGQFSSSGFKNEFKDPYNQVQHSIAGLIISSRYSWFIEQYVLYDEDESQDDRLYRATFKLGNNLNDSNFMTLGDRIKSSICEEECDKP